MPRPISRISETLTVLEQTWRRFPDQRLGQLLANASRDPEGFIPDLFNVEDDEMLEGLEEMLGRSPRREPLSDLVDEERSPWRYYAYCDVCGEEMGTNMMGMGICPNGHERNPMKESPDDRQG